MKSFLSHNCLFAFIFCFGLNAFGIDDEEKLFQIKIKKLVKEVADVYEPPSPDIGDPEKYYWPKTLARFHRYGIKDAQANRWVGMFVDHSPFHFTLVGMARIMLQYPDAPAVKTYKAKIIDMVLKRNDSHNFFTSEGTENHINMARTSGYLYVQEHLKSNPNDAKAAMQRDSLENWVFYWSKKIYQVGTGEWNSSSYEVYNLLGWLNLYDFADDPKVRNAAKAVVDYYVAELALHNFNGAVSGSEMRGNLNTYSGASYYFNLMMFSADTSFTFHHKQQQFIQSVYLATTGYRPAKALLDLGRKTKLDKPAWFQQSKTSYLFEEPSFVKQWLFVHNQFTLGASSSPYGGFSGSTSQIVNWKLVSNSAKNELISLSGNGPFTGGLKAKVRDPYTQFFQHKNILFQLTRMPANYKELNQQVYAAIDAWKESWRKDFEKRFPDEIDKRNVVGSIKVDELKSPYSFLIGTKAIVWKKTSTGIQLAQVGKTYVAAYPIAKSSFAKSVGKADEKDEFIWLNEGQFDALCGFVLVAFDPSECKNMNELKFLAEKADLKLTQDGKGVVFNSADGDEIQVVFQTNGRFEEAIVDWGFGPQSQQVTIAAPPFKQPTWPSGEGFAKMPSVTVNQKPVDLAGIWPVFSGPWLTLQGGLMRVKGKDSVFEVDYTGAQPFSSESETVE